MNRPVAYIERTRNYYAAQGFTTPYRWASNDDAPCAPLGKPLSESVVGLATTAVTYPRKMFDPRHVIAISNNELPDKFFADDLEWDRAATHLDDTGSYFPFELLCKLVDDGSIGRLAQRSCFLPTEYSQRKTIESDANLVLRYCVEDQVDALLMVPL